jgi:hypothetical protein
MLQGDTVASSDADGVVKVWDIRMVTERLSIQTGNLPANKCAFDASGNVLAVPTDEALIRM